jgi:predicted Zn-dependent protease
MINYQLRLAIALAAVMVLALAPCANAGLFKVSLNDERSIGKDYYANYKKEHKYLDNTPDGARVKLIGQRLVQRNTITDWNYTFTLVDDKEVNAFAVPGGYIFLNKGLYDYISYDDSMISAVLAHEMGHIMERHFKKMYEKSLKAQMGMLAVGIAIGGENGQNALSVMSLGGSLAFLKYSRDDEEHSDRKGVELSYGAGYDPYGMSRDMRLFQKLDGMLGQEEIFDLWRTHPQPKERIERCRGIAKELSGKDEAAFGPPSPPKDSPLYAKPPVIIRKLPDDSGTGGK